MVQKNRKIVQRKHKIVQTDRNSKPTIRWQLLVALLNPTRESEYSGGLFFRQQRRHHEALRQFACEAQLGINADALPEFALTAAPAPRGRTASRTASRSWPRALSAWEPLMRF